MRAVVLLAIVACGGNKPPATEPDDRDEANESSDDDAEPRAAALPQCDGSLALTNDPARVLVALDFESHAAHGMNYSVVVFRDGLVQYLGRYAVLTCEGDSRLEPAQMAELVRMFEAAGFLALDDEYTSYDATHYPMITLTYAPTPARVKRVKHYRADRRAPLELKNLEDDLDQLLDIDRFIGTQQQRDAAHPR